MKAENSEAAGPLNLLPGSGDPSDTSKRHLRIEGDFVTCTQ